MAAGVAARRARVISEAVRGAGFGSSAVVVVMVSAGLVAASLRADAVRGFDAFCASVAGTPHAAKTKTAAAAPDNEAACAKERRAPAARACV
jgi:hypothetical protein